MRGKIDENTGRKLNCTGGKLRDQGKWSTSKNTWCAKKLKCTKLPGERNLRGDPQNNVGKERGGRRVQIRGSQVLMGGIQNGESSRGRGGGGNAWKKNISKKTPAKGKSPKSSCPEFKNERGRKGAKKKRRRNDHGVQGPTTSRRDTEKIPKRKSISSRERPESLSNLLPLGTSSVARCSKSGNIKPSQQKGGRGNEHAWSKGW